jgi:hypothetical protein
MSQYLGHDSADMPQRVRLDPYRLAWTMAAPPAATPSLALLSGNGAVTNGADDVVAH